MSTKTASGWLDKNALMKKMQQQNRTIRKEGQLFMLTAVNSENEPKKSSAMLRKEFKRVVHTIEQAKSTRNYSSKYRNSEEKFKSLAKHYLYNIEKGERLNERAKSVRRIKKLMHKAKYQPISLQRVLDKEFNEMNKQFTQVSSFIKYNRNFL